MTCACSARTFRASIETFDGVKRGDVMGGRSLDMTTAARDSGKRGDVMGGRRLKTTTAARDSG